MANKDVKRCSALLTVREIQIKITMRLPFAPTRMAVVRKMDN